jgi:sporulation protein YlmC with PRC-barrel domain
MADTTQFTIGTEANCNDGSVGTLSRVIVDPVAQAVTHLVIDPKHGLDYGRLVPLDLIDCAAGGIQLRCSKAEFTDLAPAEETQFLSATDDYNGYGPGQVGFMPYYGLGSGMFVPGVSLGYGGIPPEAVSTDTVPLGEVEVRRGEAVHATDGDIGHVQGLVIDPASRHVTHVLLKEGHLWGRKEVAIPISVVASTADGIQLTITKQEVQSLPPVDIDHPEKSS